MAKAEEWDRAQALELEHWRKSCWTGHVNNCASREEVLQGYTQVSKMIWQNFDFAQDAFRDKTVLDIGCGPTGRCLWLEGNFFGIDPLVRKYRDLPWAQIDCYESVFDVPAEETITSWANVFDAVICINCLDHCMNPLLVMQNAFEYLRPEGFMFLSVDCTEDEPDEMHPSPMRPDQVLVMIREAGFHIGRVSVGRCYQTAEGKWLQAWGGGTAWHFWLSKPKEERQCGS